MIQNIHDTIAVCIVLHAHLPYVRNSSVQFPLEELWLYQNIAECYLQLIQLCCRLKEKNAQPKFALSVSPTLLSMLTSEYYQSRFETWCLELCNAIEILRNKKSIPEVTLQFYQDFLLESLKVFHDIRNNCVTKFNLLSLDNTLELMTTAGTHPFFPLYRNCKSACALQIAAGLHTFYKYTNVTSSGFWLPELGYFHGIDALLRNFDINYTIVNDKSVLLSSDMPKTGNFYPAKSSKGLVVLPRDAVLSLKIWSAHEGYPGHPYYREFHRDAMFELPELSHTYRNTLLGLKLYAITGRENKEYYDPHKAVELLQVHVDDFIDAILKRAHDVEKVIGRKPVCILPFDAELFGHWWFEGPKFLELFFEKVAERDDITCVLPKDVCKLPMETIEIVESSWGRGSDFSTWYSSDVRMYVAQLDSMLYRFSKVMHSNSEMVQQCAREILLAMASDWQFMIATQSFPDYAKNRLQDHIHTALQLLDLIEKGIHDSNLVQERFLRYPVFEDMGSIIDFAQR